MTIVDVRIIGRNLPGLRWKDHHPIFVGVQRDDQVVDLVPGDAGSVIFDLTVDVVDKPRGLEFLGPYAHGSPLARFIYLSWGSVVERRFEMFRRAKLMFDVLDPAEVRENLATGNRLQATVDLTDAKGGPLCGTIRPPKVIWEFDG
jgi:hypothetical protein